MQKLFFYYRRGVCPKTRHRQVNKDLGSDEGKEKMNLVCLSILIAKAELQMWKVVLFREMILFFYSVTQQPKPPPHLFHSTRDSPVTVQFSFPPFRVETI